MLGALRAACDEMGAVLVRSAHSANIKERRDASTALFDPDGGGTHLPDVTVISPIFSAGELVALAASRAHHADVGGPTPGSMPADSRSVDDEGVVIEPCRL